jgi:hypothetical protein
VHSWARQYGTGLIGTNLIRHFLADPDTATQAIVNWPDLAWAGTDWLRHQRNPAPDQHTWPNWSPSPTALTAIPPPIDTRTRPALRRRPAAQNTVTSGSPQTGDSHACPGSQGFPGADAACPVGY